MYKIQLYDKFAPDGFNTFDLDNYSIKEQQDDPDGILVHSHPLHDVEFGKNLKSIVRIGTGVNTIPVDKLTQMGVAVFNCPGGNSNAVKELTIAAMIMLMRNAYASMAWVKSLPDEESKAGKTVEKGKNQFKGPEIYGKTLGVIGAGAIGSRMIKSCDDLGMKVMAYDPYLPQSRIDELSEYCTFVKDINDLLHVSDVVTVHIPYTPENKEFVNAAKISQMKEGSYLINYARGQVLDNDAVCDALDSGKIKGFATDFPTPRQMERDDIIFTPHLGAGTPEADIRCSVMAAKETMDFIENGNVSNSVNFPCISFPRAEGTRVTILHDNKVGMLGKVTDVIVTEGLNIENLVNKAKDGIAYTMVDFNDHIDATIASKLEAIDGVIRVRVID